MRRNFRRICFTLICFTLIRFTLIRFLMLELRVVEICIESAFFEQFVVRAFFDDVALVHNEDNVGVLDCGKAVRDDK